MLASLYYDLSKFVFLKVVALSDPLPLRVDRYELD